MYYEQIRKLRKLLKMTQREFGERLGVSRDVIANIECNRVKPQAIFINHLCTTFSVNPDWLKSGGNSPFIKKSINEEEVVRIFQNLSPNLQDYALNQIKLIYELQKKQGNVK